MTREDHGRRMAAKVRKLGRHSYAVPSETISDYEYVVKLGKNGWYCECPDRAKKKNTCKHMYAVFVFRKPEAYFIRHISDTQCPKCLSTHTISKGHRRRHCKVCDSYYTLGVKSRFGLDVITEGMNIVFGGSSLRKARCTLSQSGTNVAHRSILNWLAKYGPMIDEYTKTLRPRVGDHWRIDEVYVKVSGKSMYAFHMLDTETRYITVLYLRIRGLMMYGPYFVHV